MKRLFICILLSLSMICGTVFGWTPGTYTSMTGDAVKLVPNALKNVLLIYGKDLERGVLAPCKTEGSEIHCLHVDSDYGKAHLMVERLGDETVRMIKEQKPFSEICRHLGTIAHLVADINNPLHTSDDDLRESKYYDDYTAYMERKIPKFILTFDGYGEGFFDEDLSIYLKSSARRARRSYDLLGESYYRHGRLLSSREFDDRSTPFGVASLSYCHAVSDIAKVWNHIWFRAGGNMRNTLYLDRLDR